ncbi:MAG: HAD hydrolase-like protein, partial [Burkholderiales bacterium]
PIDLALKGSSIIPSQEVWFVGDSLTDMECAYNAGCTAIFYGEDEPTKEIFAHCPPHLHCKDHVSLLKLIDTALQT